MTKNGQIGMYGICHSTTTYAKPRYNQDNDARAASHQLDASLSRFTLPPKPGVKNAAFRVLQAVQEKQDNVNCPPHSETAQRAQLGQAEDTIPEIKAVNAEWSEEHRQP
jgi:hypothetical protein